MQIGKGHLVIRANKKAPNPRIWLVLIKSIFWLPWKLPASKWGISWTAYAKLKSRRRGSVITKCGSIRENKYHLEVRRELRGRGS